MSTEVSQIKVYKNGSWQDITKVHDGSTYQNFRGVYSGGVWYELLVCSAWDVEYLTHNSQISLIDTAVHDSSSALQFKPDGTKLYHASSTIDEYIYQYDLSIAWDLSTAVYNNTKASLNTFNIQHIFYFKPDGTKIFVGDYNINTDNSFIRQYSFSTAWDLSTINYDNIQLSSQCPSKSLGLYMKSDGTKLYELSKSNIYQWSLSAAWDLSTATADGSVFSFSGISSPDGLYIKSDGTKFYTISTGDEVYQYNFSTAWDFSTASYEKNSSNLQGSSNTSGDGLFFKDDGTKFYHLVVDTLNSTGYIDEYIVC